MSKVAIVTGASRGAGAGIARALGAAGMIVYVTGRTTQSETAALPGTIHETAAAIDAAGGKGIAAQVDHSKDEEVKALLERVAREQGRLDILVNNVAVIHDDLIRPGGFWEKDVALADILDIGLRSHYIASYYAAPLMVKQKSGLIAFTSSFGGVCYMHGPAYGAQKAGVDKFAADMAVDLKDHNVAAISLWMGPLITERTQVALAERPDQYEGFMAQAETPEFNGRLIAALADDPKLMERSGQTLIGAEIAPGYGVTEAGGRVPPSYREMLGAPRVASPAIVR